ncbi:MAG: DNA polymerase III subunit gamma/tau [Ruminococcaceae bacterium]|nr:DNA polymerase III subunit gamma/tau [Oscillospiraceae bacterium]
MDYVALYRKWRPVTFDEVVEQDSVVTILKNTVKSRRIAHAYLFCGTRGTGKTTMAKIFARAINCQSPIDGNPCNQCEICKAIMSDQLLDISEIDAASNNGVENIRQIIENSAYASSRTEYKVFIIDEVHMLSTGAFNALLKTLEEPPANVVFILATTEPHKLPITILSRCQRYDFKRISRDGIAGRLEEICRSIGIDYEENAIKYIAQKADGALRDGISLLDQTIAAVKETITLKDARSAAGALDRDCVEKFAEALLLSDSAELLKLTDDIFVQGRDPSNFITEVIEIFRNILVVLNVRNPGTLICETGEELETIRKLSGLTNVKEAIFIIRELAILDNTLKWAVQRKILFEAGVLAIADRNWSAENGDVNSRLKYLEERVSDLTANGLKVAAVMAPTGVASSVSSENIPSTPTAPEIPGDLPDDRAEYNIKAEKKDDIRKNLKQAEELDWNDFIAALSDKKKGGIAGNIRVNSKGYMLPGSNLYIVFNSTAMKNLLIKQNCTALLEECASSAFGKKVNVHIVDKNDFAELDITVFEEKKKTVDSEKPAEKKMTAEEFGTSVNLLKQLSAETGFEISGTDVITASGENFDERDSDDENSSMYSEEFKDENESW